VSEASERADLGEGVVAGVLEAVAAPAVVCDLAGVVRACNDAFETRTAEDRTVEGRTLDGLVEWAEENPVTGVLDGDDETTAPARLIDDGRRYGVTARPLTGDGLVGAVVVFDDEPEGDWPVYRAALDAAPDIVYVVDTDYRFRAVSERFEERAKIPRAELVGERMERLADYGLVSEETVTEGREALDALFDGEKAEVQLVSEGVIEAGRITETRLAPVTHDGEVVGAVADVRDVTERERSVEARQSSEQRLRTILDTMPVAMLVLDGDGRVDHVQGLDFEHVHCDRSDLVGERIDAFAGQYGSLVDGCRRALDGAANSATVTLGERTYEAVFEPVRENGEVTGTIAAAVDVTDRERRERELATTNERLDLALENTEAGVHEWEIGQDRVYWHETTSRLFGLDPETNYRSRSAFVDQVHPDDRERVQWAVEDAIETDGEVRVEYRVNDPGEEPRWLVSEGEIVYDDDGEPDRLVGTVRDITERKQRERELAEREQRLRAVIESSADPIAMQDTDGHYRVVNEAMVETTGCPRSHLRGATPTDVFQADTASRLERHRRDVLSTDSARVARERIPGDGDRRERTVQLTVAPYHGPDGVQGTVTIARDITELERQRDELETLTAIQELVQKGIRGVTSATTREEIKRTVCDRLASSTFYEGAWIGSRDGTTKQISPDYAAGGICDYLDGISIRSDTSDYGQGPAGRAYRTGEIQVVDDIREDPTVEHWRADALEYGLESVAVVPLTHGSTTHGILVLYTDRPDTFSDRELDGFETLGTAVGSALGAAQHRRLLESDRVLELSYETETQSDPFVRASNEHSCRLVFEKAVHAADDLVITYLTVEDADPEVGGEVARSFDLIESVRRLDGDDGPHYELRWTDSLFHVVADAGARGTNVVVEDGVGTLNVEAPGDIDVRRVTESLQRRFPELDLVTKRERESTDTPWWHVHGDIGACLTDRQRDVLQAAYYSGYYEWPRKTDAETLADSLDIATSTLLQHLRKGHNRVLEATFDS